MAKRAKTKTAELITHEPWAQRPSGVLVPTVALAATSYRAGANPRRRFHVSDGSGDYHLDDHTRREIRSLSRDLERNCAWYDGLLTNTTQYVIGSGPRPIPASSDDEWNRLATELWRQDAAGTTLDSARQFTWPQWCSMLLRGILRDGDTGVIHHDDATALLVESDRVTAVEVDELGRTRAYRVAPYGAYGSVPPAGSGIRIDATQMDLPAWRTRPSQRRGHPACSASLDDWERLDSLLEAEVISAETAALPWIIVSHHPGASGAPPRLGSTADAPAPGPSVPVGWGRSDAGSMLGLPPGLDGKPWTPNRPNLDVPAFARHVLKMLCLPLLPYEVAFLDLGELNYAAIRGVGRMAKRKIDDMRTLHLEPVLSRRWRDWARAQMLAKRLPFVRDFAAHRWDWDQLEIRDREKDATAVGKELANGTLSLQDELGPTWRDTVSQRDLEATTQAQAEIARIQKIQALCNAANESDPNLKLHWAHILTAGGAVTAPGAYLDAAAPQPAAPTS